MTFPGQGATAPPPGELRELRMRLATVRAGIADLQAEWDTTVELARHLRSRRREAGQPDSTAAVLADLEISMRASAPLPHTLPPATPVAELRRGGAPGRAGLRPADQPAPDLCARDAGPRSGMTAADWLAA